MNVELKRCYSENVLESMYDKHDGTFLCVLRFGSYIVGELEWEQGQSPNYYVLHDNYKYYFDDIKLIGILPAGEKL